MKKHALITALLLTTALSQSIAQKFQSYIGTKERSEVALDVKALPDGGSVMVGYTTQIDPDRKYDYRTTDMMIVRVDKNGNVVWNRRYGLPDVEDKFKRVVVAQNGDFLVVGHVGLVPFQYPATGQQSTAAVYRIDAATGNILIPYYLRASSDDNSRGEVFNDIVELDNRMICVVGNRDYQPAYVDGMVTLFDAGLNPIWHRNVRLDQSNELVNVTQFKNRIFAGGFYYANTYYDLHIIEFDINANVIWSNRYDYTAVHKNGTAMTTNWMLDLDAVEHEELRVLTQASTGWGAPPTMSGIMSVDMNGGAALGLSMFNDPSPLYANMTAVYHESYNRAYYAVNPSNISVDQGYPNWMTGNNADALTAIVDPVGASVGTTALLMHDGTQSLNAINLLGVASHYAGSSIADPNQIGAYDIYYVRSENGLPEKLEGCPVEKPDMAVQRPKIDWSELGFEQDEKFYRVDIPLEKWDEKYEVRMLCYDEPQPCEIDDITFCGSQANPYTWTFNVSTTPAGSSVYWDFGDFTGTISTAGTPVSHSYAGPGSYTVCVAIIGADGEFCDRECITICVNQPQPQASQKKVSQQQQAAPSKMQDFKVGDIYPNPTDGSVNIPLNNVTGEKVTVRVLRMDGVVMYNREMQVTKGADLKVNIGGYAPGNYMFEITNGANKTVKMVSKQ